MALSQRKYTLDLLHEAGLLGCKPVQPPMNVDTDLWDESGVQPMNVDTDLCDESGVQPPMNVDTDLWDESGPIFEDVTQYKRLEDKLIYLIVTRLNITYVVV